MTTRKIPLFAFAAAAATALIAVLFATCEKVPDYCGTGEIYDPSCEFCFGSKSYSRCGGRSYNPLTEGCGQNAVGTRCIDESVVPLGTPCGGYALTTAATPAAGGDVTRTPDKPAYAAREQVVVSAVPQEGFAFAGWAGSDPSPDPAVTLTMTANKPMVAMFRPIDAPGATAYRLITTAFPENGGDVSRSPDAGIYNAGETVTVTAAEKPGYKFVGWSGASESAAPSVRITMNQSQTLVAMFTPMAYTLTVNANPAEGGAVFVNGTALKGATPQNAGTEIEAWAVPAAGYYFAGWSGAVEGQTENRAVINVTNSDMTLTANFKPGDGGAETTPVTAYELTTNANPAIGGSVSLDPDETTYNIWTQVKATATPEKGYAFAGWSGAAEGLTNPTTIVMDRDKTLTAEFISTSNVTTYNLTVNADPGDGGSVSRSPSKTAYNAGEKVTVTAAALGGYKFIGWSGASSDTTASLTVTVNGDMTLNAIFQQQTYTLTVGANPTDGGAVSREPEKPVYTYGERVIVTAAAEDGYDFTAWSGASTSANARDTIVMNGNKTLTANFRRLTYTLTANVSPQGGGTAARNLNKETYTYGEQVTVTAAAAPGYEFSGWSGALTSTSAGVTITMNGNKTLTANFQQQIKTTYTLSTIADPAVGAISRSPDKASYEEGEQVAVTAPTVDGYIFTGWTGAATGTANPVTIIMNANKTLTANYRQNTYSLTTTASPSAGGTVSRTPNQTSYTHDASVTVTAVAAPGYTFTGWTGTGAPTSATATAAITITMNEDKTLTAHFQQLTYTLTTNAAPSLGGTVTRTPNKDVYIYDEQVTVTAVATDGYTFTGWTGAAGTAASVTITMTDNKTLTANFQQNQYSLTTTASPAGSGTMTRSPNKETYTYGEQVTVTATAAEGYRFTGWAGASTATTASVTITMNGDRTLAANFQQLTYTLTTNAAPSLGGTVTRVPNKEVYTYDELVTVTATAAAGYTFTGWTGATGTGNTVTIAINGNTTLTANFQQNQYSLTTNVSPAGGGTVSRSPNQTTYTHGTTITVTATAAAGYTFTGWSGASTATTASVTVTMNGDTTLTANFQQNQYSLTTNVSPVGGGTMTRSPNQTTYTHGTTVTVTAMAAAGYTFTGWTGASTATTASVTVTMNGNTTLTANFQQNQYSLTTSASPAGGGTMTRSPNKETYTYGEQVTVTATAAEGYRFTKWSGASTATTASVTVIMNDNIELTANFQQNQYALMTFAYPSGGGTVSRSPNKETYIYGEQVTVTATAAEGYRFTGWADASTDTTASVTITMNGSKALTANFQQNRYTLTTNVSPLGGGTVSRSPNQTYYTGTTVTVTATAASGYTFTGWAGASTATTTSVTITMNDNKELTANFQQNQYSLTVEVSPSGGGTVSWSPNQTTYTHGTTVTVMATAASVYTFTGWSGASTATTKSVTITMNGDRTLTANFQRITIDPNTVVKGTFTDSRDGQTYKTVKISSQTWMAENLNYEIEDRLGSWCYDHEVDSCAKYGRLYNWATAKMACPAGWKLPSRQEWDNLVTAAGGSSVAGKVLKSQSGWNWNSYDKVSGNGTDDFGFSALPGGSHYTDDRFDYVGDLSHWWTATENGSREAYYRGMLYTFDGVSDATNQKYADMSVRCIADAP